MKNIIALIIFAMLSGPIWAADFSFDLLQTTEDLDNDGVPDSIDMYLDSDTRDTVVIDDCDSEVVNIVFPDGYTLADLVQIALNEGFTALDDLLTRLVLGGDLSLEEATDILVCTEGSGNIDDDEPSEPKPIAKIVKIDVTPPKLKNDKVSVSAEVLKVAIVSDKATDFQPVRDIDRRNVKQLKIYDVNTPNKVHTLSGISNKYIIEKDDNGDGIDVNSDGIDDLVLCYNLQQMLKNGVINTKTDRKLKVTKMIGIRGNLTDGKTLWEAKDTITFKK